MPRESKDAKKIRALKIIKRLKKSYPEAECALIFETPFQLLVATILSAQCTDKRVNMVTPELFKKYPDPKAFAKARVKSIETLIRSTGFYQNKAKNIKGAAEALLERHGGEIPQSMEELVQLPGVGRKTANVVMGNAYGVPSLTVDTHMIRLNNLLGLTTFKDPVKIEFDLMEILPKKDWVEYTHLVIHHGRARCIARRPDCSHCELLELCPGALK